MSKAVRRMSTGLIDLVGNSAKRVPKDPRKLRTDDQSQSVAANAETAQKTPPRRKKKDGSKDSEPTLQASTSLQDSAEQILKGAEALERQAENIAYSTLARKLGKELAGKIGNASKDRVKKLLQEIDTNGDGRIQKIELRQLVRNKMSIKADNAEIDALFDSFDDDRSGEIDAAEFGGACHMLVTAANEGSAEVGEFHGLAMDERQRAQAYLDAAEAMRAVEAEEQASATDEANGEGLSIEEQVGRALFTGGFKVSDITLQWDEKKTGTLTKHEVRSARACRLKIWLALPAARHDMVFCHRAAVCHRP